MARFFNVLNLFFENFHLNILGREISIEIQAALTHCYTFGIALIINNISISVQLLDSNLSICILYLANSFMIS